MPRGRRLTAAQCLAFLQQLDENSSNDDSDNESNFEISDEDEIEEHRLNSSEEETDADDPDTSNATRTQRDAPTTPGRIASQNVLKEKAGPTPYTHRNIGKNEASSYRLLFLESMLMHIQKCTSGEVHQSRVEIWFTESFQRRN